MAVKITSNNGAFRTYSITNHGGLSLHLTNIGAAITAVRIPVSGRELDVVLGYGTPEAYLRGESYFGAVIGRYANRIRGGRFEIDGVAVQMDRNEGENTLHSGFNSYSKRPWYPDIPHENGNTILFRIDSPDGDQGLPGKAAVEVEYTLTNENAIRIRYRAAADKTTVFNLTNHSYFNLNGHESMSNHEQTNNSVSAFPRSLCTIEEHTLQLACSRYTPVAADFIPTGEILSVKNTPFDFTVRKPIGQDIRADDEQIRIAGGYDHNFVIDTPSLNRPFASLRSELSGLTLDVYTDSPAVQFYTGNGLGNERTGKNGVFYAKRGGLCLETQFFPDSPNHENFPGTMYRPGQTYESTTIYAFTMK